MKIMIFIYIFLLSQVTNAQLNDITSSIFSWITYPTYGEAGVQVFQDYTNQDLIKWNDDKVINNDPIYIWSFDTELCIPSNLVGKENEMKSLLVNAVSSWNNNYTLKMEIDDNIDEAVLVGFANNDEFFEFPGGGYASGRVFKPVIWNDSKEQFETYEFLVGGGSLTEYIGLDVFFFSQHAEAPIWTTSTTPDGEDMLGTVLLHELGHVLCMGHSSAQIGSPRIMDGSYDPKNVVAILTAGDISNATFHYNNLYNGPTVEGSITFSPTPGLYIGTQTITMEQNDPNYTGVVIKFNYNLNTNLENAEIETPDLSTDNMQYTYGNGYDTNARKVSPGNYWYYFKAKLYNPTYNIFVGQQTEGAYKAETNPSSKISGSTNNLTFIKDKGNKQIFQNGDIYNED